MSWLEPAAKAFILLSILSALAVWADIRLLGRRQPMKVMEAVWPLTMLYWGPIGLAFYAWLGRAPRAMPARHHEHGTAPMWQASFKAATHCGAGCALGDVLGESVALATGFALAGSALAGRSLLAFVLAYLFGIVFQLFSQHGERSFAARLRTAITVDTFSLLAYEAGMLTTMAALPKVPPASWRYWLGMQAAMLVGFATTYPMNWWLIRRGIKQAM